MQNLDEELGEFEKIIKYGPPGKFLEEFYKMKEKSDEV